MTATGIVKSPDRLAVALLLLRYSVFIVMLMWTLDKFINPAHSMQIFARFYGLDGVGVPLMRTLAVIEFIFILGFVIGIKKRLTYGFVLVVHSISTLSSWRQYLDPFENLLFFAAFPMLAACWALYSLRELDTLLTPTRHA